MSSSECDASSRLLQDVCRHQTGVGRTAVFVNRLIRGVHRRLGEEIASFVGATDNQSGVVASLRAVQAHASTVWVDDAENLQLKRDLPAKEAVGAAVSREGYFSRVKIVIQSAQPCKRCDKTTIVPE